MKHNRCGGLMGCFSESARVSNYKYKYQGQELQDELGLGWYSFKWRNYDPAIGRFMSLDPLAEKFKYMSPYQFSSNNPIWLKEIEGLEGIKHQEFDTNGNFKRHVITHNIGVVVVNDWKGDGKRPKDRVRSSFSSNSVKSVKSALNKLYNGSKGEGAKNGKGETVFFNFNVSEIKIGPSDKTTLGNLKKASRSKGIESGEALGSSGKNKTSPMQIMIGNDPGGSVRGNNNQWMTNIVDTNDDIAIGHETGHQLLNRSGNEEHDLISTYDFNLGTKAVDAMLQDALQKKDESKK